MSNAGRDSNNRVGGMPPHGLPVEVARGGGERDDEREVWIQK